MRRHLRPLLVPTVKAPERYLVPMKSVQAEERGETLSLEENRKCLINEFPAYCFRNVGFCTVGAYGRLPSQKERKGGLTDDEREDSRCPR